MYSLPKIHVSSNALIDIDDLSLSSLKFESDEYVIVGVMYGHENEFNRIQIDAVSKVNIDIEWESEKEQQQQQLNSEDNVTIDYTNELPTFSVIEDHYTKTIKSLSFKYPKSYPIGWLLCYFDLDQGSLQLHRFFTSEASKFKPSPLLKNPLVGYMYVVGEEESTPEFKVYNCSMTNQLKNKMIMLEECEVDILYDDILSRLNVISRDIPRINTNHPKLVNLVEEEVI